MSEIHTKFWDFETIKWLLNRCSKINVHLIVPHHGIAVLSEKIIITAIIIIIIIFDDFSREKVIEYHIYGQNFFYNYFCSSALI